MIEVVGGELRLGKGDWQSIGCPEVEDYADEFIERMREKRRPSCTGYDGRGFSGGGPGLAQVGRQGKGRQASLIE